MARRYEQRARAEQQEQTRQRIVRAALDLHRTVGPAASSFSAVAERAGVQRSTLYRHFPDERALYLACSGLHLDEQPFPDPSGWSDIRDPLERAEAGLGSLYAYWERNERLIANVLRDGETDAVLNEVNGLRMAGPTVRMRDVLASGWSSDPSAALTAMAALAIDFRTWRTLVRGGGLTSTDAAGLMATTLANIAESHGRSRSAA